MASDTTYPSSVTWSLMKSYTHFNRFCRMCTSIPSHQVNLRLL